MTDCISKEAALNLIEHNDKVCHYADERYENVVYATTQMICKAVAEMPAADFQPVKWISCKERMPEDNDRVLILAKNESVYIAKHRVFGHFVVSFEYWLDDTEVTHWMPLPEPPKDGDTP